MKSMKLFLATAATLAVTLVACDRERFDNDWQSEQDNAIAEQTFDDVYKQVDTEAQSGFRTPQCSTVNFTYNADSTVADLTIDFGTACLGTDGRLRSGRILAHFEGRYRDAGSVVSVTFDNYYVNGNHVEGTKTITNNGRNAANNLTYTVQVTGARITDTDGRSFTWESTRTNEWIAGESTTFATDGVNGITDDIYLISGSATGVNRNGVAWGANITTPLRRDLSCKWLTSGVIEVTRTGRAARSVDFGYPNNGDCDNQALAKIGTNEFPITLR